MRKFSLLILMIAFAFLAGCAMPSADVADNSQPADTSASGTSAQAGGNSTAAPTPASPPVKMVAEFDDIPVPAELKRNDDLSFIYQAPGVTMGVVTYSGYYKGASIAKFYRSEMPNYGWQFLNAFSEGNQYMVAFLKQNRSCIVNIDEGTLSTKVTIKVGPTAATTAGVSGGTPNLRFERDH